MRTLWGRVNCLLAFVVSVLTSGLAQAQDQGESGRFLVLGVIAYENPESGVALIKDARTGATSAVRSGMKLAPDVTIRGIHAKFLYVRIGDQIVKIGVGEQVVRGSEPEANGIRPAFAGGVEKAGNTLKVSAAYRDHLAGPELQKVLMQVAAVPHYVNGVLEGFKLWDIDQGSIYDQAGFANGDVITAINGQPLSDVGKTIKLLHSMRNESRADISFVRRGVEQSLTVEIQ